MPSRHGARQTTSRSARRKPPDRRCVRRPRGIAEPTRRHRDEGTPRQQTTGQQRQLIRWPVMPSWGLSVTAATWSADQPSPHQQVVDLAGRSSTTLGARDPVLRQPKIHSCRTIADIPLTSTCHQRGTTVTYYTELHRVRCRIPLYRIKAPPAAACIRLVK
jgi:hypothetical protein